MLHEVHFLVDFAAYVAMVPLASKFPSNVGHKNYFNPH